jgi:esterase/lipase
MCHTGGSAEISLSGFSVGGVINASKGTQAVEIDPDPLVVMSCTVEMQRYVITQIFLEKHA